MHSGRVRVGSELKHVQAVLTQRFDKQLRCPAWPLRAMTWQPRNFHARKRTVLKSRMPAFTKLGRRGRLRERPVQPITPTPPAGRQRSVCLASYASSRIGGFRTLAADESHHNRKPYFAPRSVTSTDRFCSIYSPVSMLQAVAVPATLAFPPTNNAAERPRKRPGSDTTSAVHGVVSLQGSHTLKYPPRGVPP